MSFYSKKSPLEIFEGKNIVIVTAHPDDEVFCIAHVLKEIQTVTKNISWINTTLGQNSIDSKYFESSNQTGIIRESEFIESMEKLKVDKYLHLKIPSYLSSELPVETMSKIQREIDNCDYLFLIDKNDQHPDHYFTTKSFEKLKNKNQIFYYNVQKVTLNKKLNYFYSSFNEQLFEQLIGVYKSQSHMEVSFDSYKKVFSKKVFIYNENIN
ncbi:PIG-L family deacetylase [Flavobacterium limnosediminis]|nr:PIG-L family deacetylase [Flavobacterium limnosediminis]